MSSSPGWHTITIVLIFLTSQVLNAPDIDISWLIRVLKFPLFLITPWLGAWGVHFFCISNLKSTYVYMTSLLAKGLKHVFQGLKTVNI